ncbi:hypothetical protein FNF29_07479 [Cafeteria roenbergensis]|uniref:peptidylprolyl isomerase n=1 Tax=Cafeteria roenbergensis TaxID=33653 RepID=A0A5A8C2Q9_CAFRO|nr:hypothetical protein FNF29_07479 [Cafeteria roenbergensis]|eukprot:KAA0147218.1 hypothetical protein FNF29_07479 [Cafeteria roenbergensis]
MRLQDAPFRIGVKVRPEKCDRRAKDGDRLSMHYTGTLYADGSKFDSLPRPGLPFEFTLAAGTASDEGDDDVATVAAAVDATAAAAEEDEDQEEEDDAASGRHAAAWASAWASARA